MNDLSTALEHRYFNWLYSKIGTLTDPNPRHSHWLLAETLHNIPFWWSVPNDDNRAVDGMQLRDAFCDEVGSLEGETFIFESCSVLEMLIALAARASYDTDGLVPGMNTEEWFWLFMQNLGISARDMNDEQFDLIRDTAFIKGTIERLLGRKYKANGHGGLFPMVKPKSDQRKVELAYQLAAYLLENFIFGDTCL